MSSGQPRSVCRLLQKLKELSSTWERALALRGGLERDREDALAAVQVKVAAVAHAGVQLVMGGHKVNLNREVRQPVFTWSREGIDLKIAS